MYVECLNKGIRRGLVVTKPGSQLCVCNFESPLGPQVGWRDRYINVRHRGGLSMAPSATERSFETIREEKGISSHFQISISLQYDLSC